METLYEHDEHLEALRDDVCSCCIERRPHAPPCAPIGKACGIEQHVSELVDLCRTVDSSKMAPYIEKLHDEICPSCSEKDGPGCPCPLDYLLQLAVETVERVRRRRAERENNNCSTEPAWREPEI
jgi:hypothetical protein